MTMQTKGGSLALIGMAAMVALWTTGAWAHGGTPGPVLSGSTADSVRELRTVFNPTIGQDASLRGMLP